MKLWLVSTTIKAVIASDEPPKEYECENALREEIGTSVCLPDLGLEWVTNLKQLPHGWASAVPYGGDAAGKTCAKILGEA